MKSVVLIAAALLAPAPALAETVYQLSREEAAAVAPATAPESAMPIVEAPLRDRGVHGEAGVAVGTGGYRSTFGSMATPIGDDGWASFGFETGQFGNRNRRAPR